MSDKDKITVRDLLKSKGYLFPSTAGEVNEFEKNIGIDNSNPPEWENPINIILKGRQKIENIKEEFISNLSVENLAMAAREGKKISDDVWKRMNEDRENAKKK